MQVLASGSDFPLSDSYLFFLSLSLPAVIFRASTADLQLLRHTIYHASLSELRK